MFDRPYPAWPTAALIAVTHHVSQMLESCSYVRCVLVDYSKAFDTINHSILFSKLGKLSLSGNILGWIYNFLRLLVVKQAVVANGHVSEWLPISQSIVQGSGLGPYLYIIYAADLKPLHSYIIKYADDTTLLVAEHSAVDIVQEFKNLQDRSENNKLKINLNKTKKIIFRQPSTIELCLVLRELIRLCCLVSE